MIHIKFAINQVVYVIQLFLINRVFHFILDAALLENVAKIQSFAFLKNFNANTQGLLSLYQVALLQCSTKISLWSVCEEIGKKEFTGRCSMFYRNLNRRFRKTITTTDNRQTFTQKMGYNIKISVFSKFLKNHYTQSQQQ